MENQLTVFQSVYCSCTIGLPRFTYHYCTMLYYTVACYAVYHGKHLKGTAQMKLVSVTRSSIVKMLLHIALLFFKSSRPLYPDTFQQFLPCRKKRGSNSFFFFCTAVYRANCILYKSIRTFAPVQSDHQLDPIKNKGCKIYIKHSIYQKVSLGTFQTHLPKLLGSTIRPTRQRKGST